MNQYKIIGADGKEYGPITAEQIRQWIAEGRANAQTKVLPEGAADWQTLGSIAEFAPALAAKPAPIAPLTSPPPAAFTVPAADRVSGPAIGLIVTAIVGIVANLVVVVLMLVFGNIESLSGMPPEAQQIFRMFGGIGMVISTVLGLALSVVVLYGALRLKELSGYGWAMTATILALFPCTSPCCLAGLPIGIWALVVLLKPEVKSAFH